MGSSGGLFERKRIWAIGSRAAAVSRAVASIGGHVVLDEESEGVDLIVVDADGADALWNHRNGTPIVALVPRRLRGAETEAFRDAGASAVIDAESSVLDVAFVFSDLLFATYAQRRRYGRNLGGVGVRFRLLEGTSGIPAPVPPEALATVPDTFHEGRLVDLGRTGAFVLCAHRPREGAALEIVLDLLGRPLSIRGRVAFSTDPEEGEIAVELALDDVELAAKVFPFCLGASAGERTPARGRAASGR